jgi:hypothetical protein
MRLNMDFQTAVGQEGSMQREKFIKDLTQDLAHASGTEASDFNVLKLSAGSVIVDVLAPAKAAQEIHRQSLDPNSRLRTGSVTRFTDTIRLPTGAQQPQLLLADAATAAAAVATGATAAAERLSTRQSEMEEEHKSALAATAATAATAVATAAAGRLSRWQSEMGEENKSALAGMFAHEGHQRDRSGAQSGRSIFLLH